MTVRDEVAVSGVWEKRDERTIRNELGREFACSENIDIQIGRVLKKLDAMGELDNTYIFYTSDHGMAIGRHGLQGKQNLYQHTWRVPLIVKGPGSQTRVRVPRETSICWTCSATLCDLWPASKLRRPTKASASSRYSKANRTRSATSCTASTAAVRSPACGASSKGDWKLIKYEVADGEVRETQLFNLAENPHEFIEQHHDSTVTSLTGSTPQRHQVNLANDPRYADKLAEMEALLLAEMRRLDDPYRLWNQPDDGLAPVAGEPKKKARRRAKKL